MWDQEQYLQTFKDRLTDPIEDSIIAMVSLLPILALKGTKALSKGSWAGALGWQDDMIHIYSTKKS